MCFDTSSDVVLAWHLLVKLLRDQAAPLARAPLLPAHPVCRSCTTADINLRSPVCQDECSRVRTARRIPFFAAGKFSVLLNLGRALDVDEAAPRLGLCSVRLESLQSHSLPLIPPCAHMIAIVCESKAMQSSPSLQCRISRLGLPRNDGPSQT